MSQSLPPESPIRVLVVDDSAFARKVMREVLEASPGIEVIGIARDGLDALEKIEELRPDVITLDLIMPNLDGLGLLRALPERGAPRVVIVSMADGQSDIAVAALAEGAVDLVHKPTALAIDRLYELSAELVAKVRAAAQAKSPERAPRTRESAAPASSVSVPRKTKYGLMVVGASTGGPNALGVLLRALPADFPVPIAVVLHIPAGFTESLAQRLDGECALEVVEASPGMALQAGRVVIARGGLHLKFAADAAGLRAELDMQPNSTPHRPAVDVLFQSAAKAVDGPVLAVVLTGMGDDGLAGARAIQDRDGIVLTEAESSCVVYGMPRVVQEAGLSSGIAPIGDMAALVLSKLSE